MIMSFFDRIRGERGGGEETANPDAAKWDMSDVQQEQPKSPEQLKAERQQRKIIAAFATGENGDPNLDVINQPDVELAEHARSAVLDGLASGEITTDQQEKLLNAIRGNVYDNDSMRKVYDVICRNPHEMRILAMMTGKGFNGADETDPYSLSDFVHKYPNPMTFESAARDFLDMIARNNSPKKLQEYVNDMDLFQQHVYGKKFEYYKQLDALNEEATQGNVLKDGPRDIRSESERSGEWAPGSLGYCQASRAQTKNGEITSSVIAKGNVPGTDCEDSYLIDDRRQTFGVFDGAGGLKGGQKASMMLASIAQEYSRSTDLRSGADLAAVLNQAHSRIASDPEAGISTAVLTRVVERDGRKFLAYASAGDSRIYLVRGDRAHQITRDEGEGRVITNGIGIKNGSNAPTRQYGEVHLEPGDKIVLCSDGITGDYGGDLMSNAELAYLVNSSRTAMEASRKLVSQARKKDDRTAVVFAT